MARVSVARVQMQFARWAMQNPDQARDAERICSVFLVRRRTAYRWRRDWLASGRMVLPCDVGARRNGLPSESANTPAREEAWPDELGCVNAACGVGRHG